MINEALSKYTIEDFEAALEALKTADLEPNYEFAWTLASHMLTDNLREALSRHSDSDDVLTAIFANGLLIGLIAADLKHGRIYPLPPFVDPDNREDIWSDIIE